MWSNPTFLSIQVLNSLALGMNLYIIAVGLTLIFGVLRIINFAHGVFYMTGGYLLLTSVNMLGTSNIGFFAGLIIAPLAMGAIAFIIERFLLSRLYDRDHFLQLLFTFALVLIFKDLVKIFWGAAPHSISSPPLLSGAVDLGITRYPLYLLSLCIVGPMIAVAMWLFFEKTIWGRIIRAARLDREMLSALGTDVKMVYTGVFVAGSMLAALGGALAAPRVAVDPSMDALVIIDCFVIVIIGGLGSLWGSFVGAICLGLLTVFGTLFLGEWQIVVVYLFMVVLLLTRPWGLFGRPDEERH